MLTLVYRYGAELQNLLKLFGALVDGWLVGAPNIPTAPTNTEKIIYYLRLKCDFYIS